MIDGLIKSTYEILGIVESITGKGFDFIEKPDLQPYASVSIARKNMPKHIIVYKKIHEDLLSHLIAHEII
jgi:hypothetical protein